MRFSGHESFPLRYAWLPKAFHALEDDPMGLANDEAAMVRLGIGKNMVIALRFWVEVAGVATPGDGRGHQLTDFARAVFAPAGLDPYLEDIRTLWLIHWNIATHRTRPVFAWQFLLNDWQQPELCRGELIDVFLAESARFGQPRSRITVSQHLDVFLHCYLPTQRRARSVKEDVLDCPLIELELLREVGERRTDTGRREAVFAFRREPKPEISDGLFAYCLNEYWTRERPREQTLSFRDVAVARHGVGQVFKLPETDLRERLERLERTTDGALFYRASAAQATIGRRRDRGTVDLATVYAEEDVR
jgi:hypothetical protein